MRDWLGIIYNAYHAEAAMHEVNGLQQFTEGVGAVFLLKKTEMDRHLDGLTSGIESH